MHQKQKHMFKATEITLIINARTIMCACKSVYEIKETATLFKNMAIDQQDWEQAALFRDIEKNPEKFPIGGLTNDKK